MKIAVSGATGFVGRHLVTALGERGDEVIVFTRNLEKAAKLLPLAKRIGCDFRQPISVPSCDALIHLGGEPIFGKRWGPEQKEIIRTSRVKSTEVLCESLQVCQDKPGVFICASAIGYYGNRGESELIETSPHGTDFLAMVCEDWERAAQEIEKLGIRVVIIRIGIVLGRGGGALQRMLTPFKLGLGGPIGSGQQWMSWIHIDDLIGIILFSLGKEKVRGSVNATAPNAVRNSEFGSTLGRVLHRPAILPLPAAVLRLGLGEVASVLVSSQKVVPRKIQEWGYSFKHPTLETALRASVS